MAHGGWRGEGCQAKRLCRGAEDADVFQLQTSGATGRECAHRAHLGRSAQPCHAGAQRHLVGG